MFEPVTVEDYVVSRDYDGLMEYLISNDSGVPEVSPWYLSMVLWVCKLTTAEVAAGAVTVLVVHDVDIIIVVTVQHKLWRHERPERHERH